MTAADMRSPLEDERLRADSFTLEIDGKPFWNWSEVELKQSIDCFSSVGFMAPFEPDRPEFRETFRPFSFRPIKLYLGDELVFTGNLTNVQPSLSREGASVHVECLSLPAVLENCCVPHTRPASAKVKVGGEYRGIGLHSIAADLCAPFGIGVVGADDLKATPAQAEALRTTYPKCKLEPDATIFSFLCGFAKQRGLLMTDDALGRLVFQVPTKTGNAVVQLEEGIPPLLGVKAQFEPNECFSEVTCIVVKKRGWKAGAFTEDNRFLKKLGVVRPHTFKAADTRIGDGHAAARARIGRMLANMANWEVDLPTFRDKSGRRFRPNTTITLKAPSAMVYGRHEFLVRDVTLHQDSEGMTSGLGLVMPGAFGDEQPSVFPWNEAL